MKKQKRFVTGMLGGGTLLGALVLGMSGCQSPSAPHPDAIPALGMVAQNEGAARGVADIWAKTCIRCHSSRSAASFTDSQWDVAMMHMRIQAKLTADEHHDILEFLKASN